MALELAIGTIKQSNDNKTLTITVGSGVYDASTNPTGWGAPNARLQDIDGTTNHLTVQVTITTSDGVETTYQAVDFYVHNEAAPTAVADLVFTLTCADLLDDDDVPLGTSDSEFPDGWYDITYSIVDDLMAGSGDPDVETGFKLISGQIRNKIFIETLAVPYHKVLSFSDRVYNTDAYDILFPLYTASLYESMNAFVTAARQDEILSILETLENLTS